MNRPPVSNRVAVSTSRLRWALPVLAALTAACAGEAASDAASAGEAASDAASVASSAAPGSEPQVRDTVHVEIETAEAIEAFFEEVGYDSTHWQAGVREVPRMYLTEVPPRWGERAKSDLTVQAKKRIFFRAMAPLALRANELILSEREELLGLPEGGALSSEQRAWLADLAADYGLEAPGEGAAAEGEAEAWDALMEALALRVDEVPVSLVLAQAANESGWGTSRFASQGNALFGQWAFGGSGMLPEAQRSSLGDYRVASFESPLLSVVAYMRNLNTHAAYARLRELRAQARSAGQAPRGHDLAAGLDRYSERGQAYVDELRSMIDYNGLAPTDETYLAQDPVYIILPVVADEEG